MLYELDTAMTKHGICVALTAGANQETTVTRAMDADVVVLSDSEAASALAACVSAPANAFTWYANVEDLMHARPLSSVAVLVVDIRPQPKGVLLAALGRMNLEYPAMQKIAVVAGPPPLPIASYLTACGVDLVWAGAGQESMDQLATVMNRTYARTKWIVN